MRTGADLVSLVAAVEVETGRTVPPGLRSALDLALATGSLATVGAASARCRAALARHAAGDRAGSHTRTPAILENAAHRPKPGQSCGFVHPGAAVPRVRRGGIGGCRER